MTQDATLGGSHLRAGDRVLLGFAAANHDPAKFERPDEVIIDRSPNHHVGFGVGAHRCVGQAVAKRARTPLKAVKAVKAKASGNVTA